MKYYLKERDTLDHSRKNAGSKARNDVESICEALGYRAIDVELPYKDNRTLLASVLANLRIYAFFKQRLSGLTVPTACCSRTSSAFYAAKASAPRSSSTTSNACATVNSATSASKSASASGSKRPGF